MEDIVDPSRRIRYAFGFRTSTLMMCFLFGHRAGKIHLVF